jgi:hypothetical protein
MAILISPPSLAEEFAFQIADKTDNMDKLSKLDSAKINYVKPEGGESYHDILIGYKGTFSQGEIDSWLLTSYDADRKTSFTIDLDKGTEESNLRESIAFGISWDFEFTEKRNFTGDNTNGTNLTFFDVGASVIYKQDSESNIDSAEVKFSLTPFELFNFGIGKLKPLVGSVMFYQGGVFNFSYKDVLSSPDDEDGNSVDGKATRFWFTESLKIYPFFGSLKEQVELAYTGEFGTDLNSTGVYKKGSNTWVNNKLSINYYFTCDKIASFGYDYVNGEDRRNDKEDYEEIAISLKFKWPASKSDKEYCDS